MRNHPSHRWAYLVVVACLLSACQKKEGTNRPDAGAPAPPREQARLTEVRLGHGVNSAHQVEQPADEFAPRDTIWASVKTESTPPETQILARWVYTEGGQEQIVAEDTHTTAQAGTGYTSFFAINPSAWPAGSYELRVGLDGEIKDTKKFSVKG
jgi:hypothetical protein